MFITTQNEILSVMPTAKWDRPQQLFGWIEEEERVALEPLLGTTLYQYLLEEYDRLRTAYGDITATTVRPTGKAKKDAKVAHADVTERLEQIQKGKYRETFTKPEPGEKDVPKKDLTAIRLIRICQQIEFYKMLSHKAGLLTVSLNEGGGANRVSAENYEPADDKEIDRMTKDAFMSAGRAIDSLLLFLEADAKGDRLFTEKWQEADAFYLHKDLLFQTARVLNEYLPIKGERMAYVELVRDIRFCQNTYVKTRIGGKLLKAVIGFANEGMPEASSSSDSSDSSVEVSDSSDSSAELMMPEHEAMDELLDMLRTALAFYVESRKVEMGPQKEKMARRDSMIDAQQAMATACQWIEEHLDALGDAATDTPIYNAVRAREAQEAEDKANAEAAAQRQRRAVCQQNQKKLFTGFPATHRNPEYK